MQSLTAIALSAYMDGYMSKEAIDTAHPAMQNWLGKAEGFLPKAMHITNAQGEVEPHKTVGTGHNLSPDNQKKLTEQWGPERYKQISSGSSAITPQEDWKAAKHHLENIVPKQLDSWNPNWRKLNPMMRNWLMTHVYSLGDNIGQFEQGSNAVNAMVYNPTEANAERLRQAFRKSRFADQTGTRLDKVKPLFESGKRIALQKAMRGK